MGLTEADLARRRRYALRLLERETEPWRQMGWSTRWHQELAFEAVLEIVPPGAGPDQLLLDVGCGHGELYEHLRANRRRIRYRGIDVLPEMVERARKRHAEADFSLADPVELDPGEYGADYAVSAGALRLVSDDASRAGRFVQAMGRLGRRAAAFTFPTADERDRSGWVQGLRDLAFHDPGALYAAARAVAPFVSIRAELPPGQAVLSMQHGVPASVGRLARRISIDRGEELGHEAAGALLLGAELFDEAMTELALAPETPRNLSMRAEAAFNLQRMEEAETLSLRAMELGDHAEAALGAGVAAAMRGFPETAIQRLRSARKRFPLHESIPTKLALILLDAEQLDEAEAVALELAELEPARGAYLWALAALKRGDFAGARERLERAVAQRGDYVAALATLASLCEHLRDEEAAVQAYQRVLELRPHHPAALGALSRLGGIKH